LLPETGARVGVSDINQKGFDINQKGFDINQKGFDIKQKGWPMHWLRGAKGSLLELRISFSSK